MWDWDLSSPGTVIRGITPSLNCLGLQMHQAVQWPLLNEMLFSEETPKIIILGEAGIHPAVSRVGLCWEAFSKGALAGGRSQSLDLGLALAGSHWKSRKPGLPEGLS